MDKDNEGTKWRATAGVKYDSWLLSVGSARLGVFAGKQAKNAIKLSFNAQKNADYTVLTSNDRKKEIWKKEICISD